MLHHPSRRALEIWQRSHGELSSTQATSFLARRELGLLANVDDKHLEEAIQRSPMIAEFAPYSMSIQLETNRREGQKHQRSLSQKDSNTSDGEQHLRDQIKDLKFEVEKLKFELKMLRYPNHGKSWTDEDRKRIGDLFESGMPIELISEVAGRTPYAIQLQLEAIGFVVDDNSDASDERDQFCSRCGTRLDSDTEDHTCLF